MTGDDWGLDEDDSPGPDVWARLEGRALLDLRCGTGDGARGPIRVWYRRTQGLKMVLGPGPELEPGPAPFSRVY